MDINLSKLQEIEKDREAWYAAEGRKELDMMTEWKRPPYFRCTTATRS